MDVAHVGGPPRLDQGEGIRHLVELVGRHAEGGAAQVVGQRLHHEGLLLQLHVEDVEAAAGLRRPRAALGDLAGVPGEARVEAAGQRDGGEDGRVGGPAGQDEIRPLLEGPLERLYPHHGDDPAASAGDLGVIGRVRGRWGAPGPAARRSMTSSGWISE